MLKKVGIAIVLILILIQFIRVDQTNPVVNLQEDFISLTNPPENISAILKTSCYDCHSHETEYPWYTNIAPVSFFLANHIKDGRKHLNFSTWGQYTDKKKSHKLKEFVEMVEENEMPMFSYTLIHRNAILTDLQKKELTDWVKNIPSTSSTNLETTEEH